MENNLTLFLHLLPVERPSMRADGAKENAGRIFSMSVSGEEQKEHLPKTASQANLKLAARSSVLSTESRIRTKTVQLRAMHERGTRDTKLGGSNHQN